MKHVLEKAFPGYVEHIKKTISLSAMELEISAQNRRWEITMAIKIYQPYRKDLLINTRWGVPKEELSKDEAKRLNMRLFHGRWVTKEEKRQIKQQRDAYYTIRGTAVILILLSLWMFPYLLGRAFSMTVTSFTALYGIFSLISGIGLWWFKVWARTLATPALAATIAIPFLPQIADDKGVPIIGFLGIIGLYFLYRKTARTIFSGPASTP